MIRRDNGTARRADETRSDKSIHNYHRLLKHISAAWLLACYDKLGTSFIIIYEHPALITYLSPDTKPYKSPLMYFRA